jgi:hypothetical protein
MPDGSIERIFRHTLGAMGSFSGNDTFSTCCEVTRSSSSVRTFVCPVRSRGCGIRRSDGDVVWRKRRRWDYGLRGFCLAHCRQLWKFLRIVSTALFDICCITTIRPVRSADKRIRPMPAKAGAHYRAGRAIVHCGAQVQLCL